MQEEKNMETVPVQVTGTSIDVVEKITADSPYKAENLFQHSSIRLLSINNWDVYAGISGFQLLDKSGVRVDRLAEEGDFVRIDIPGPGTNAGKGYDWVKIEQVKRIESAEEQILSMTVRPCAHPLSEENIVAHFLQNNATSTFIIRRKGLTVFAEEHGRNELPNTNQGSMFDKSRNFVVGMAAKLGLSFPQWKSLVVGLLKNN